jgi:hypothetical protein
LSAIYRRFKEMRYSACALLHVQRMRRSDVAMDGKSS